MELADCPRCASLREELNFAFTALSVLREQLAVLAPTDQHETFISILGLCREAERQCADLRDQREEHEASHRSEARNG